MQYFNGRGCLQRNAVLWAKVRTGSTVTVSLSKPNCIASGRPNRDWFEDDCSAHVGTCRGNLDKAST